MSTACLLEPDELEAAAAYARSYPPGVGELFLGGISDELMEEHGLTLLDLGVPVMVAEVFTRCPELLLPGYG